jgi:thiamine thiazole synthase
MVFKPVPESEITRAIATSFIEMFSDFARSVVIVVGAGPAASWRAASWRREASRCW